MKIDHIGYLCKDITTAIMQFEKLGYSKCSDIYTDNIPDGTAVRNVFICFLINGGYRIELVSPINETSDVFKTLKRQGEGPYHICYQVDDLDIAIKDFSKDGWLLLKRPAMAVAFNGSKVAFLFRRNVGMIELVEMKGITNETA